MQTKYANLLLAGAASFSLAACTSWLYMPML